MAAVNSRAQVLASLDEFEVEVEKLVAGGDGLARHQSIPILVPLAAPGDRLRVRLVERQPDYGRAEILEILEPGPGRREAPCPHYEQCGGCNLQHLEDRLQTDLKVEAALETLRRLAGIQSPPHQVLAAASWGYRLRTCLQIAAPQDDSAPPRIGYFARGSHDVVPVSTCPILDPALESALERLAARPPDVLPRRLDLAAGAEGAITAAPVVSGLPHGEVELAVGPFRFTYDARCFFQAHRELLEPLSDAVVGSESGQLALDLYAGVGLFSLPLARRYERVVAVEGDRVAARFARANARRNRLRNVEVQAQAVETFVRALPEADRVVVNPPRSGLQRFVASRLARARPSRLTYVSCHPATLARDLERLASSFRLTSLTFVDLFPQTGHLETVAQLEARPEGEPEAAPPGPGRE